MLKGKMPVHWLTTNGWLADGNATPGKDSRGNVFGTYHWANESGKDLHCGGSTPEKRCAPYQFSGRFPTSGASDFSEAFHVYSIDWNATAITWSVDGQPYWQRHSGDRPGTDHSAEICSHEMYIILNTAVQAPPPPPSEPAHYPTRHLIDWVRVYEWVGADVVE